MNASFVMNIGTNERDHPNSSPLNSPSPRQPSHMIAMEAKQVWLGEEREGGRSGERKINRVEREE